MRTKYLNNGPSDGWDNNHPLAPWNQDDTDRVLECPHPNEVGEVEFECVYESECPQYKSAYISRAWDKRGREYSEEQCEMLKEQHMEWFCSELMTWNTY